MVFLTALWLPIVLSAVFVFIASSVIHMALPIHKSDYGKMAKEDDVLSAMREAGVKPGDYMFPYASEMKEMGEPEMVKKLEQGPVGMVTIWPNGPMQMGSSLAIWFAYCIVIGWLVAYITGRTFGPGTDYLQVFRVAGTVAFLAYAGAHAQASIWFKRSWSTTLKHTLDGLVYGLLTAGTFGWLWP